MKKIWLMGGFGNVLFQILLYEILSKTNKHVFYVNKLTKKNSFTKFLGWTIHEELYNDLIDSSQFKKVNWFNAIIILLVSLYSKKLKRKNQIATFYNENILLKNGDSRNLFGYFQEKEFLSKNKKELLSFGNRIRILYSGSKKHPIVVHYRKGDSNLALQFSYYYEKIKDLLKKKEESIIVVTDSLDDGRDFFKDLNCTQVVCSENAIEDFKILLSAKKIYCAPSTFSWWAAHCMDHKAEVIMPNFFENNLGIYVKAKKLTII